MMAVIKWYAVVFSIIGALFLFLLAVHWFAPWSLIALLVALLVYVLEILRRVWPH